MGFVSRAPKAALEDVRPVEDLRDGGDDLDDLRERVAGARGERHRGGKKSRLRAGAAGSGAQGSPRVGRLS
jgi:hypothetical protein